MENVFNLNDGTNIHFNPNMSNRIASFAFPPFGYLDLYINLNMPIVLFYMKPRYKNENEPGFTNEFYGPSDIIEMYSQKLADMRRYVTQYVTIVTEKMKKETNVRI